MPVVRGRPGAPTPHFPHFLILTAFVPPCVVLVVCVRVYAVLVIFLAGVALALVDLPSFFLGIVGHRALLPKPSPPAPVSALPQPLPVLPNELRPSPAAATRAALPSSPAGACEHRRRGVHFFHAAAPRQFSCLRALRSLCRRSHAGFRGGDCGGFRGGDGE